MKKCLFLLIVLTASIGLVISCSKSNKEDDNEDKITLSRVVGKWIRNSGESMTIQSDKKVHLIYHQAVFKPDADPNGKTERHDIEWYGYIDDQKLILHFTTYSIFNKPDYPIHLSNVGNPIDEEWIIAKLKNYDMTLDIHIPYTDPDGNPHTELRTWSRAE